MPGASRDGVHGLVSRFGVVGCGVHGLHLQQAIAHTSMHIRIRQATAHSTSHRTPNKLPTTQQAT